MRTISTEGLLLRFDKMLRHWKLRKIEEWIFAKTMPKDWPKQVQGSRWTNELVSCRHWVTFMSVNLASIWLFLALLVLSVPGGTVKEVVMSVFQACVEMTAMNSCTQISDRGNQWRSNPSISRPTTCCSASGWRLRGWQDKMRSTFLNLEYRWSLRQSIFCTRWFQLLRWTCWLKSRFGPTTVMRFPLYGGCHANQMMWLVVVVTVRWVCLIM